MCVQAACHAWEAGAQARISSPGPAPRPGQLTDPAKPSLYAAAARGHAPRVAPNATHARAFEAAPASRPSSGGARSLAGVAAGSSVSFATANGGGWVTVTGHAPALSVNNATRGEGGAVTAAVRVPPTAVRGVPELANSALANRDDPANSLWRARPLRFAAFETLTALLIGACHVRGEAIASGGGCDF